MRNALVVIDMQNDFCLPNAILCVKGAMGCLPHVIEAVETARSFNIPIIWVIREHHPSGKPSTLLDHLTIDLTIDHTTPILLYRPRC